MTRTGRSHAGRQQSSAGIARHPRVLFGLSSCVLASVALAGCALDDRKTAAVQEPPLRSGDAGAALEPAPGSGGGQTPPPTMAGQEGPPPVGGIAPSEMASGATSPACESPGGSCVPASDAGSGGDCVPTGPRDCTSSLDNDCDGRADDTPDDVCVCVPGSVEPCDDHPGLDGRGQCRAGSRACSVGDDNQTSNWGACEGSVGPGEQDSCSVEGDDTNCDGTNNGGCPCIEGETRPCGPETDDGICQRGSQTCAGGSFGQCVGAVFAAPRDCASSDDNDCDGSPDDGVDNVCTCVIGAVQACGAHPGRDGNGQCRAGSQTCQGRANNATSGFGACTGSVGPALQDTCVEDDDSNCNGLLNEGCACINGESRACGPDTELGVCQRGTQTCSNGSFGQCQGAVFPAPRDCESPLDNDCDGRPDDTFDNVCLAPQNPFSCGSASPPATVLPFNLFAVDPATGGPIFPPGQPPSPTGGTVQNGRYVPIGMEVYGQANAPAFAVNELTFEFRDGFVQVGYQGFIGTGAVLGSDELSFVGSVTPVGSSLRFDVDSCDPQATCSAFSGITCDVPAALSYSATASGMLTIAPASDGSSVVTTYSRQ